MEKIYTVYKATNKVNGKYYIGVHKTTNPYDDYIGSGKYLKRAIEKYGIENFEKEILAIFENPEEAFALEAELVTFELIESGFCYNIKEGGQGGFDLINKEGKNLYGLNGKDINHGLKNLIEYQKNIKLLLDTCPAYRFMFKEFNVGLIKKMQLERKEKYPEGTWKGKNHTNESKKKIGEANSVNQLGNRNSQYNTKWISNIEEQINKKVPKDYECTYPWVNGRNSWKIKSESVAQG